MKELIEELKSVGAKSEEAKQLAALAEDLKLKIKERSTAEKLFTYGVILKRLETPERRTFGWGRIFASVIIAVLLLTGTVGYVAANSLPGENLYTIKIAGENFIGRINPSFKESSALRRSEEIKNLTKRQSPESNIDIGLQEYKKQIKSLPTENPIRQQSQRNLEEARNSSSGKTRESIEETIEEGSVKGSSKQAPENNNKQNKGKNEDSH